MSTRENIRLIARTPLLFVALVINNQNEGQTLTLIWGQEWLTLTMLVHCWCHGRPDALNIGLGLCFVCLIWFFTFHQQSFSYKGTGLPGLSQCQARINVLAQGHNTVRPVRLEPVAPIIFACLHYYTFWTISLLLLLHHVQASLQTIHFCRHFYLLV